MQTQGTLTPSACMGAQWFKFDPSKTLRHQLAGKTVVEFPELVVVLPGELSGYDIINDDVTTPPVNPVEPSVISGREGSGGAGPGADADFAAHSDDGVLHEACKRDVGNHVAGRDVGDGRVVDDRGVEHADVIESGQEVEGLDAQHVSNQKEHRSGEQAVHGCPEKPLAGMDAASSVLGKRAREQGSQS